MKYDGSGNIQVAVAASDFSAVDMNLKSLGVGVNGASGTEGIITLRNGANPGTTKTLSYTKWAELEAVNGLVACNGSGDYSAVTDATSYVSAASTTLAGKIEVADSTETSTGTDATRALSPDGLAGSVIFGTVSRGIEVVYMASSVVAGASQARVVVPSSWNGRAIVGVIAIHDTAGSAAGGDSDTVFDINKNGTSIFTGNPQIDKGETSTLTGSSGTIKVDGTQLLAIGDLITVDIDSAPTGTAPLGFRVVLEARVP